MAPQCRITKTKDIFNSKLSPKLDNIFVSPSLTTIPFTAKLHLNKFQLASILSVPESFLRNCRKKLILNQSLAFLLSLLKLVSRNSSDPFLGKTDIQLWQASFTAQTYNFSFLRLLSLLSHTQSILANCVHQPSSLSPTHTLLFSSKTPLSTFGFRDYFRYVIGYTY